MKLVIYTQIMENYGAHDWDGIGECPQHWKAKGGEVYVVENVATRQDADAIVEELLPLIESSSDSYMESIAGDSFFEDDHVVCEPWESVITLRKEGDDWCAKCVRENGEYGYMHKLVAHMEQTFVLAENGATKDHACTITLTDGRTIPYADFAKVVEETK